MTKELVQTNSAGNPTAHPVKNGSGKQKIVVVLGMHRSGTSLLTNLLNLLGVELGEDLLAANKDNEQGYWENESIYKTQDALMNEIAKEWGELGFAYPLSIDWKKLPQYRGYQDRLTAIVRSELAKAKGIWGFKDPRTCRLLPIWKPIFAELNLEPLYVLAVRNPSVVKQSLQKMHPVDYLHAELIWLLYYMDAIRDAGQDLRIVVDYDRWFSEPREQAQAVATALGLPWPSDDAELISKITRTIRPDLCHSKSHHPCSLPFVTKTHQALKQAAATGKRPDEAVLSSLKLSKDCIEAALEFSAGLPKLILAFGHAEIAAGNLESAVEACRRASRLQPRFAQAHSSLALTLLTLGRWNEALNSAGKALSLDSTNTVALKVLAKCQLKNGQLEAAERTSRLILQHDSRDANALHMIEEILAKKEEARKTAEALFSKSARPVVPPSIEAAPIRSRKPVPPMPVPAAGG